MPIFCTGLMQPVRARLTRAPKNGILPPFVKGAVGGLGSDIAIEAADMVLVGDDIREIPHLLRLSHRVMRTIHINLAASPQELLGTGLDFVVITADQMLGHFG